MTTPRKPNRSRPAYIGFWAKDEAKRKLDKAAAERGISRSEMARIVFGLGLAALGGK